MRNQRCAARNREQLLHQLDLVSFAAYDALLYLDTHPDDEKHATISGSTIRCAGNF